jgi:hypothetical protein
MAANGRRVKASRHDYQRRSVCEVAREQETEENDQAQAVADEQRQELW